MISARRHNAHQAARKPEEEESGLRRGERKMGGEREVRRSLTVRERGGKKRWAHMVSSRPFPACETRAPPSPARYNPRHVTRQGIRCGRRRRGWTGRVSLLCDDPIAGSCGPLLPGRPEHVRPARHRSRQAPPLEVARGRLARHLLVYHVRGPRDVHRQGAATVAR